jgi:hypothetical protein
MTDEEKIKTIKKMIRQKKEIREHIENGGNIEDLDKDEYKFVQPL